MDFASSALSAGSLLKFATFSKFISLGSSSPEIGPRTIIRSVIGVSIRKAKAKKEEQAELPQLRQRRESKCPLNLRLFEGVLCLISYSQISIVLVPSTKVLSRVESVDKRMNMIHGACTCTGLTEYYVVIHGRPPLQKRTGVRSS